MGIFAYVSSPFLLTVTPEPLPASSIRNPIRVISVASPPPPVPPPPSVAAVVAQLRQGKGAVLPGRGAGLQAVLCGKRGRRALQTSEGLSDEVGESRRAKGGEPGEGEGEEMHRFFVAGFMIG